MFHGYRSPWPGSQRRGRKRIMHDCKPRGPYGREYEMRTKAMRVTGTSLDRPIFGE